MCCRVAAMFSQQLRSVSAAAVVNNALG